MRPITTFLLLFVLISISFSCEKEETPPDRLDGEISFLVGKWEWVAAIERVVENIDGSDGSTVSWDTLSAAVYPNKYFVEFKEHGEFIIYKNDVVYNNYCTFINLINESNCVLPQSKTVNISFEPNSNKTKNGVSVCGKENSDTLYLGSYQLNLPIQSYSNENYHYYYSHYYKKVN